MSRELIKGLLIMAAACCLACSEGYAGDLKDTAYKVILDQAQYIPERQDVTRNADTSMLCSYYSGHINIEGKLGSQRNISETSLFLPLACTEDKLLFSDLRFKADDQSNREGNVGLGVRVLKETGILGGYAYFDRKKSGYTDKYYNQATLGAEWLSENWEIRSNAYIPLNGEKTVGEMGGITSPFLQGNGIFVQETATNIIRERGLYGGDIEAGFKIPKTNFWLHAAGFSFGRENSSTIQGGRTRATYQITDKISVFAEGQYDDERGRQGWVGARLTVPFGGPSQKAEGLKARMTADPVRDVDIVTTQNVEKKGTDQLYEVTNTQTGTAQRVVYVDNSNTDASGGNGTRENPYTTLAAIQSTIQDHDVIYISSGNGTSAGMNQGFQVTRNNVQIIGSGSAFIYDGTKLTSSAPINLNGLTLIEAAAKPILTNISTANLSGDGMQITGSDVSVSGLAVNGTQRYGIFANATNANTGTYSFTNIETQNNVRTGLQVISNSGAHIEEVNISSVYSKGNIWHGIAVGGAGGSINSIKISHADVIDNDHGIIVQTGTNAASIFNSVEISDVYASQNALSGVILQAIQNSTIGTSTLKNIEAHDNIQTGLYLLIGSNGTIQSTSIDGISSMRNQDGLRIHNNNVSSAGIAIGPVTVENSVFAGNLQNGIYANDDGIGQTITATINDSSIYNNGTSNTALYRDVKLDLNTGTINMQRNWWGQTSGPSGMQIINEGSCPDCGTADTNNFLNAAPTAP